MGTSSRRHRQRGEYAAPARRRRGRGTRAALDLARDLGCRSVGFPLLGAGVVGLPTVEVARAMLRALKGSQLDVVLCAYSRSDREALRETLG